MNKLRNLSSYEESKLRRKGLSLNMEQLLRETLEATKKENWTIKMLRFHLKIATKYLINLALTIFVPFKGKGMGQSQC